MIFKESNVSLVTKICSRFSFVKRQKNHEIGFIYNHNILSEKEKTRTKHKESKSIELEENPLCLRIYRYFPFLHFVFFVCFFPNSFKFKQYDIKQKSFVCLTKLLLSLK